MTEKILLVTEIALILAFLAAFPVVNAGNIIGIAVCGAAAFLTLDAFGIRTALVNAWKNSLPARIGLCGAAVVFTAGIIIAAVLSIGMVRAMNNAPEKEPKLVIVLGCQVRGERPSKMLARRLDIAYGVMERYPSAMVVVSGGKGSDEAISEAECMKRYLTEKGADVSRIIMEDTSTTTFENISNSFAITDPMGLGRDITIVTDGYHQYRAALIAKSMGAGEVTAVSANTEKRFIPTYWVREWLALAWFKIR
ncbi:MAG: YdcF family protein [Ruminococcus sp.]|nr:YdcF family protein [Ruminococcus sp.]